MDINNLNKRHFNKYSKYYLVEYGVETHLLKYENCILFIDVVVKSNMSVPPYKTAYHIANHWKKAHPELKNAIGAKIFISENNSLEINQFSQTKLKYKKGILFNYWSKN
ncbi:MAG TPA: hypothetical protein ENK91_07090 [Bacteroidetes bacterium]|jgi:hypothetical protein|nr:hypothetical protein [Bacteroidota bacterium]